MRRINLKFHTNFEGHFCSIQPILLCQIKELQLMKYFSKNNTLKVVMVYVKGRGRGEG